MKTKVLIGIQARSSSTRLPKKSLELIGSKMMLDHVIESCKKAAAYASKRDGISTNIVVLTPEKDLIVEAFKDRCDIMQGSLTDVLSRYTMAAAAYHADYVVRITGDCPLIPSYVISRMMALAVQNSYDYVCNTDERFRTSMDGTDCEVISAKLLQQMGEEATTPYDREHVTPWVRRNPPKWANIGMVINYFDLSHIKLSVDTYDDLEAVREAYDLANEKYHKATRTFGHSKVHTV